MTIASPAQETDSMTPSHFGDFLARERARRGLSAPEVGRAIGVSDKQVYRYERGLNVPTLDVASRLADLLGATLDEIAGRSVSVEPDAVLELAEEGAPGAPLDLRIEIRVGRRRFIAATDTERSGFKMVEPLEREGVDVEGLADVQAERLHRSRPGRRRRKDD